MTKAQLPKILKELRKLLRPGGYLFVREVDGELSQACPCRQEIIEEAERKKAADLKKVKTAEPEQEVADEEMAEDQEVKDDSVKSTEELVNDQASEDK